VNAKDRHKEAMIQYWGDPGNEFVNRTEMSKVLGISTKNFYKHFTPPEIADIESEAVEIRKKRSGRQRQFVYKALYNSAIEGNVQAGKEFLDRTEGKVIEKREETIKGDENNPIKITVEVIDAKH